MRTSLTLGRLPCHRLIGPLLPVLLAACAGDGLLLPGEEVLPAELRVVSGDGQTAVVGDTVRHRLVVEVLDRAGRPFPGAIVVFEFVDPPNGAQIAPPNVETNADGQASAAAKLGNVAGDQPVEARLEEPASDLRVQFLLTALQRPGGGGGGGDGEDDGGGGGGGSADDGGKGKGNGKDNGKHKGNDDNGGGDDDDDHGGGDDD